MNNAPMDILVGIDFSDCSKLALEHAYKLAWHSRARLHLCHVVKSHGLKSPGDLASNVPDDFPEAQKARAELQRIHGSLSDIDVRIHLRIGEPTTGILDLIKELKPDLVVVCSHGYGLLKRTLVGSFTRQLVERSPVPVVVVPTPGREAVLNEPAPPPEPELPSVGHAVTDTGSGVGLSGVGGIGGGGVVFK